MQPYPEYPSTKTITLTGGAIIGNANATWPFAKLTVSQYKLQLNATIIGNLVFKPSDIITIEPYNAMFSSGIKINHRVDKYNKSVIFLKSDSAYLIQAINATGFLNNKEKLPFYLEEEIVAAQASGGFPVKISAAIAIAVIWNLCFLPLIIKVFLHKKPFSDPDLGVKCALGFMLVLAVLLLIFEPLQKLVLKQGRKVDDIKPFLYFLILLTGIMLAVFSFLPIGL